MASPRKQRLTRSEWAEVIREYHASGQDAETFCQAHALSRGRLRHWISSLGRESASPPSGTPPRFIEIPTRHGPGGWDIELDLGDGIALRLRRA